MIALQYERRPYLLVILLIIRIIINYTRILAEHYGQVLCLQIDPCSGCAVYNALAGRLYRTDIRPLSVLREGLHNNTI